FSSGTGYFEGYQAFDATGTWTLRLQPSGDTTGSATFTLFVAADVTGAITLDEPRAIELVPGQRAQLTFTAAGGRRITIDSLDTELTSEIGAARVPDYRLRAPDGFLAD